MPLCGIPMPNLPRIRLEASMLAVEGVRRSLEGVGHRFGTLTRSLVLDVRIRTGNLESGVWSLMNPPNFTLTTNTRPKVWIMRGARGGGGGRECIHTYIRTYIYISLSLSISLDMYICPEEPVASKVVPLRLLWARLPVPTMPCRLGMSSGGSGRPSEPCLDAFSCWEDESLELDCVGALMGLCISEARQKCLVKAHAHSRWVGFASRMVWGFQLVRKQLKRVVYTYDKSWHSQV